MSRSIGRYVLHGEIAAGGMATVHFGRLIGPAGFSRAVAIKRLHPQFARDPEFVAMFIDEARLAARIFHPNVVPTLDVVAIDAELFLVMEYVRGASLSRLIRAARAHDARIPPRVVASIVCGMLQGLHAAHEARDEMGERLEIVHRDVSPQNVLVDTDGVARVLDFGVAKAAGRAQTTREGQLKGKLGYMAPEQLRGARATRQSDVYGASVVLWEALTGTRLFKSDSDASVFAKVLEGHVPPPSSVAPDVPPAVDAVVLRGTSADPAMRYASARDMARELEAAMPCASQGEVGDWVAAHAAEELSERAARVAEIERSSGSLPAIESPLRVASEPPTHAAAPLARARAQAREESREEAAKRKVAMVVARPSVTEPPARAWRRRVAIASLFALALFGLGVAASRRAREHAVNPAIASVPTIAAPAEAPVSSAVTVPLAVAPSAALTASASPSPSPSPPLPRAHEPAPRATAAPSSHPALAPRKAPRCDPPSTTDDRGHVHFKPECF